MFILLEDYKEQSADLSNFTAYQMSRVTLSLEIKESCSFSCLYCQEIFFAHPPNPEPRDQIQVQVIRRTLFFWWGE